MPTPPDPTPLPELDPAEVDALVAEAAVTLRAQDLTTRFATFLELELIALTRGLTTDLGDRYATQVPRVVAGVLRQLADRVESMTPPGQPAP